jgi:hypothetical protein
MAGKLENLLLAWHGTCIDDERFWNIILQQVYQFQKYDEF